MVILRLIFVLVCITLCLFKFCNHIVEEERPGCFALLSSWCLVSVNVLWPFLTVQWVGLQCVIAVFPDPTLLLFAMCWLPGPEVIKLFSCTTQLSMKFQLLIKAKMLKNNDFSYC